MSKITLANNCTRDYNGANGTLLYFQDIVILDKLLGLDSQECDNFEIIHDEVGTMCYHRVMVKLPGSAWPCFSAQETMNGDWWVSHNFIEPYSQVWNELLQMPAA